MATYVRYACSDRPHSRTTKDVKCRYTLSRNSGTPCTDTHAESARVSLFVGIIVGQAIPFISVLVINAESPNVVNSSN